MPLPNIHRPANAPPILVLGWGNMSRGDDALGPQCVAALQGQLPSVWRDQVEFLDDYQLQPEHVLDLAGRARVLLVDASADCTAPFETCVLQARRDTSYTSHTLSPQALLQVFLDIHGQAAPPTTLLAIRGGSFELGQAMSPAAQNHLAAATAWALAWVQSCRLPEVTHA